MKLVPGTPSTARVWLAALVISYPTQLSISWPMDMAGIFFPSMYFEGKSRCYLERNRAMSTKQKQAKMATTILHEFNKEGQHRIVVIDPSSPPEFSAWFEAREMGYFKGFGCSAQGNLAVPEGIFAVRKVGHQTVGA